MQQTIRRPELVVCGQSLMTSHDPLTGQELWRVAGADSCCLVTVFAQLPLQIP